MDEGASGCAIVIVALIGLGWYGYDHKWFAEMGWTPAPTTTEVSENVSDLSQQIYTLQTRVNNLEECIISIHRRQDFDGDSTVCPR